MQDKQNQPVKRANIFRKSGSMIARFAAGQRLNFLKKAYRRNDGSYYDESLFGTWGLLLMMTLVTAAGGIYYHYNIFQTAFDLSGIAVAGSLLLFILAEICLVWFGLNWLRGLYNGVWKQTWADFGIFIGMAIIVLAAGVWDYDINTRAVSHINDVINTIEIQEAPFTPPPSIALYDQKINKAEEAIQKAQSSTWKGKPTGQGLDLQKANTDLIAQLEHQKSTAMLIARSEHDSLQQVQQVLVTGTAHQLADYGRMAVIAKILFILLIPLFEIKNYEVSANNEAETTPETNTDTQLLQEPENHATGYLAIAKRRNQHPETIEAKKPETPVTTTFHAASPPLKQGGGGVIVSTETKDDVSAAVKKQVRRMQSYFSKLLNGIGTAETNKRNIADALKTIDALTKDSPIPNDLRNKVEGYRQKFKAL